MCGIDRHCQDFALILNTLNAADKGRSEAVLSNIETSSNLGVSMLNLYSVS